MKIIKSLILIIFLSIGYCYGNSEISNGIRKIQESMKNFEVDGCKIVFDKVSKETKGFKENCLQTYLSKKNNGNEYNFINNFVRPKVESLLEESSFLLKRCNSDDYDDNHLGLERGQRLRDFLKEWSSSLDLLCNIVISGSYVPMVFGLDNVKKSRAIIECQDLDTPFNHFRDCYDAYCPEMVVIPSGSFVMGGTDEEHRALGVDEHIWPWDQPRHQVNIKKKFAIGKYEITLRQFREFIKETGYRMPIGATTVLRVYNNRTGTLDTRVLFTEGLHYEAPGDDFAQTENHPVVAVRREDAREFAKWLSIKTGQTYRLPYEAEWEYVTRANQGYQYYIWGNTTEGGCRYSNCFDLDSFDRFQFKFDHFECRDGEKTSARVGKYLPNQFGIHDLLANAREWVDDCWHYGYEGAPCDGSRWGEENNGICYFGVLRGGSFFYNTYNVRIAYRNAYFSSQARSSMWGFRLVREINE
ncbi:hypothetical protein DICPUDRAFT_91204 [Dictyostelium purpureum]|uniref:Sulfatase-modifying factor enzyme-like domain-containing protein n=1 Tax=Dictyostelium purpureum TaxID=5786 RepID=F0Z909_DICPU|nr:uncharacterized protein DICPUDRAFT_91204 [Dictyostelium purpureum]EGC39577.1 hypothetical protein DICPUDRAFT_91204 [Dictyostelium purpureum]|eukprot:XP_003283912.1 hypothetical protein DICPUDRAFT_91204 [Dictyostelium purpureum]